MDYCGVSDKGIVRKQNQDIFLTEYIKELNATLLAVCDGMGGAKAGNVASTMAMNIFREGIMEDVDPFVDAEKAAAAMQKAAIKANEIIFTKSHLDSDCTGMGTTLVAALVTDYGTAVINVGDSRAYHVNRYGISQITKDHSVVEDMVTRGDITRLEAWNHPNKNLITKALGTAKELEPDIFFPQLKDGEHILLCSDGLSNLVGDQEFLYEILRCPDLQECCERLIKLALIRGAPDNITAVLFKK